VIERLAPLAAARQVTLAAGDLPEVIISGDRPALIQMLTNLVENGIKYSAGVDAARVIISVGSRVEGRREIAFVRVSDNGPGIAPENVSRLFDRFYQVDSARSRGESEENGSEQASSGSGLGLSIAQWIARAHHGDIRVESRPGEGTSFEVWMEMAGA
jgi:signal transduction histidine kinase